MYWEVAETARRCATNEECTTKHPEEYARSAEQSPKQPREHTTGEIRQARLTEAAIGAQLSQAAATVHAADRHEASERAQQGGCRCTLERAHTLVALVIEPVKGLSPHGRQQRTVGPAR